MKQISITLFIALFPVLLFAQATKEIKDKKTLEVYHVLKSDHKTMHGKYERSWYAGNIRTRGYYNNGVKDSIWEYYSREGELEQKYDYTHHVLVYDDNKKAPLPGNSMIIKGTDTVLVKLDRDPIFIGGVTQLFSLLSEKIRMPGEAVDAGISGTVYISFVVDSSGKVTHQKIKKGIGYGCEEEALRVVKEYLTDWIPATVHGTPVSVVYTMPLKFVVH